MSAADNFANYVERAKVWYTIKYLQPLVMRLWFLFSSIIIVFALFVLLNIYNIASYTVKLPFPIYVKSDLNETHYIRSLYNERGTIDGNIASYMVSQYVTLRESYSPNLLNQDKWTSVMNNMNAMSSFQVFKSYANNLLPQKNINSIILKYKFDTALFVTIDDIKILSPKTKRSDEAIVYFTTQECKNNNEQCDTRQWYSEIFFEMSGANKNFIRGSNFEFKVFRYKKHPLTSVEKK